MPRRGAHDAPLRRPVVHMPCGECGLRLSYVRGDTGPLLKHMSVAHPRKQVLDFGCSEVDDDARLPEAASLEDCSACLLIKRRLLAQLGKYSNDEMAAAPNGDSDCVQVGSSSEADGLKIDVRVRNGDDAKRSKGRFMKTVKNDEEIYETGKTLAAITPAKPLSRPMPMALRHLKQAGVDVACHKAAKRTMVFHPAGKLYSNFRKFTCPRCGCEWPPALTTVREGVAREGKTEPFNQCLLTACWPLMLLPLFYAHPTVTFHMRCAKCACYLGKLDRSGSVVTEVVVVDGDGDTRTATSRSTGATSSDSTRYAHRRRVKEK